MDHAWIIPSDARLRALRHVIGNRANTAVEDPPSPSAKEFFDALDASTTVTKPVDGLLTGSHANNDGWLEAPFGKRQRGHTIYDEVIRLFAADNTAFLIPTSLHTGATPPVKLRIVGCQAGRAPEMLRVLKRVMGGAVEIVGSKLFYEALVYPGHGGFISFRYGFEAYSPTEIKTKAALVALFKTRATAHPSEFSFIDGTAVPGTQWAKWAPKDHISDARNNYGKKSYALGQKIGKKRKLDLRLQSRHQPRFVAHTITNLTVPADLTAARVALKQRLPSLPEFDATHEFPFWRRKGNPTLVDYVDTFHWVFNQSGTGTEFHGSRHDYSILVPVKFIEPGKTWEKQRLLFHFYPNPGSGLTAITSDFTEDDAAIFVTV